jgi:hypothetical protein
MYILALNVLSWAFLVQLAYRSIQSVIHFVDGVVFVGLYML